jgi:uncharacterized protein YlxW (UPF0749 family)
LTELEQHLLEAVERMGREQRQSEADLRRIVRDLSERVNALAAQVETLSALLERAGRL